MRVSNRTCLNRAGSFLVFAAIAALMASCEGPPPQAENPPEATNSSPAPAAKAAKPSASAASPAAEPAAAVPVAAPPAPVPGETPPSDAEAEAFAKSLEATLNSGDRAAIDSAFDYEALAKRAVRGVDDPIAQALVRKASTSEHGPRSIGRGLAAQVATGARYRLLRVRDSGTEQRAILRRTIAKGAADYIECVLVRNAGGKVAIADFYDYAAGGLVSEDFHQEVVRTVVHANPDSTRKFSRKEIKYCMAEDAGSIPNIRKLMAAGQFKEAMNVYKTLPDSMKDQTYIFHEYLVACCKSGTECDATIREYREKFPNDAGVDLFVLDNYVLRRRPNDELACIDRLDRAVGGDPYLDSYRASVYFTKGELAAAKKCAQKAAAAEPDSAWAQECLKLVATAEKNLSAAQRVSGLDLTKPSAGKPAADEDAKAFAEAFAKSVMANDKSAIVSAIDVLAASRRAVAGMRIPDTVTGIDKELSSRAASAIADVFGFSSSLTDTGGGFRLLRLYQSSGEQHAVFRLVHPSVSMDYYDCVLAKHADGKVRIDDIRLFKEAVSLAEIMRRSLLLALEKAGKPSGTDSPGNNAKFFAALGEMDKRRGEGQYQAALDVFAGLPEALQKDKCLLLERIESAKHVKGKPYDDALRAYRMEFPNEPNLDLLMVDGYLEHKMYDRALACIDALDHSVGGDPYLDAGRGGIHRLKGDPIAAKTCAQKAVAADPDLWPAYFCLLKISLDEKKFSETSRLLTIIQNKFPKHLPKVADDPAYAEYVKSAEYREWQKGQK